MSNTRILYGNTLLYKGVTLINIDRTCDALYWACERQGMTKSDSVTLETGEKRMLFCRYFWTLGAFSSRFADCFRKSTV